MFTLSKNCMKIILSNSDGKTFAVVYNWSAANVASKAIFKRQYWSDLYYDITFDDGTHTSGSIDLEPECFHKSHQNEIFTWHLETFWSNVSKSTPLPYLKQSDIDYAKRLLINLKKLNNHDKQTSELLPGR